MQQKKIEPWPLVAWLAVGVSGPFALVAGRADWLGVTLCTLLAGVLCWLVTGKQAQRLLESRVYCAIQYIFIIPVLAFYTGWSLDAWPTGTDFPVVPLTLLVLATLSAYRGAHGAARVGGVLFWLIAGLYGVLLIFGSSNLQAKHLLPSYRPPDAASLLVLLLPAAVQFLPKSGNSVSRWGVSVMGVGLVALSLWTFGSLSAPVAAGTYWPLYEAGKSISVLGIAERLEAFISVAATVGFFGLYSMLLSAAGSLADGVRQGWGGGGVIAAAALAGIFVLLQVQLPAIFLMFVTLILWGLLPAFLSLPAPQKKLEKHEKNP